MTPVQPGWRKSASPLEFFSAGVDGLVVEFPGFYAFLCFRVLNPKPRIRVSCRTGVQCALGFRLWGFWGRLVRRGVQLEAKTVFHLRSFQGSRVGVYTLASQPTRTYFFVEKSST